MNNKTKLQSLYEPRWARCDNAVYTFMSAFRVVVSDLEYMEADGDDKARNYVLFIQRFYFVITLVTMEHVLKGLLDLTTFL